MDAAYDLIWEYSYGAVTIDAICERAAVKKGSFYYFFTSKSDLAVAAIDAWWVERETVLKEIFRPDLAPLDRLRDYMEFIAERQYRSFESTHQVLGCPLFALGAEICTQDERIRGRVHGILNCLGSYFEEAIRDAQAFGQIKGTDAAQKARTLLFYYAGVLTHARIENNPAAIRTLSSDILAIIGARTPAAASSFSADLALLGV